MNANGQIVNDSYGHSAVDSAGLRGSELLIQNPLAPHVEVDDISELDSSRSNLSTRDVRDLCRPTLWIAIGIDQCTPQCKVGEAFTFPSHELLEFGLACRTSWNSTHMLEDVTLDGPDGITFK